VPISCRRLLVPKLPRFLSQGRGEYSAKNGIVDYERGACSSRGETLSTHSEMHTEKALSKAEVATRGRQRDANEISCFGAEERPAAP